MACLLALCTTGSAMAATSNDEPLQLLDTCLTRLHDVEHATHAKDKVTLSDSCPELSLELNNPQLDQLEPPLEDKTSLGQLQDVQRSLLSLQPSMSSRHAPALTDLKQILKKTYTPDKQAKSIENPVDKLLDWISKKIRNFFQHDNWLTRHFHFDNEISKNTVKGIFNIIVVLMVVIVLFIIVNELRAANIFSLFKRRRNKRQRLQEAGIPDQDTQHTGIREISELPLNRQIPALLRHTLQQLMDKQVLPRRYNLTNQEFLGIIKQTLPSASRDFELLVTIGDRVVYGNKTIAADDARQFFDRARYIEQLPAKDHS